MTIPPRPGAKPVEAPAHLERQEKRMWRDITAANRFEDPASTAMLRTALEAHQRARRCREQVDRDGEAVKDRWDQLKPHPLLAAERDARAAFLSAMKALNLDLGVTR